MPVNPVLEEASAPPKNRTVKINANGAAPPETKYHGKEDTIYFDTTVDAYVVFDNDAVFGSDNNPLFVSKSDNPTPLPTQSATAKTNFRVFVAKGDPPKIVPGE